MSWDDVDEDQAVIERLTAEVARLRRERDTSVDLVSELAAERDRLRRERACPCLHATPCHSDCTCVNPVSSRGCSRCCSYGSPEQRRAQAERLALLIDAGGAK